MSLPTLKWLEFRPIAGGHFGGAVPFENQVTAADTAPSAEAVQVPDDTPEHTWEPGRQWLHHAGPLGIPTVPGE
jgi:hypothetical protein